MNNQRILDDAAISTGTTFWAAYIDRIKKLKTDNINTLAKIEPEGLKYTQGIIFGLGLVLGLPDKIISEAKENKT